mmetsp:Transcript_146626/g.408513  ORF Transcript_146626/g.408513 Transcript_146626/m.408513 type:complete len:258 (-) Transcript_146626:69-842(-)
MPLGGSLSPTPSLLRAASGRGESADRVSGVVEASQTCPICANARGAAVARAALRSPAKFRAHTTPATSAASLARSAVGGESHGPGSPATIADVMLATSCRNPAAWIWRVAKAQARLDKFCEVNSFECVRDSLAIASKSSGLMMPSVAKDHARLERPWAAKCLILALASFATAARSPCSSTTNVANAHARFVRCCGVKARRSADACTAVAAKSPGAGRPNAAKAHARLDISCDLKCLSLGAASTARSHMRSVSPAKPA